MSAGPQLGNHRHSSMRHISMSQSHVPDMLMSTAKKRFTPPPSTTKSSMAKSSINSLNYGNQFKQISSSQMISDKVIFILKLSLKLSYNLKVHSFIQLPSSPPPNPKMR